MEDLDIVIGVGDSMGIMPGTTIVRVADGRAARENC